MHQNEFKSEPFPFLDRQIGELSDTKNLLFGKEARIAHQVLQSCLKSSLIDKSHIRGKILDFGCGFGGSTAVLGIYQGDVTAVDLAGFQHHLAKALANKIIRVNGVEYLSKLPANSLDLITAFMIGPEFVYHGICKDFYLAAQQALKPDGRILVTSDYETIATLSKISPKNYSAYLNSTLYNEYDGEVLKTEQLTFIGIKSPCVSDHDASASIPTISNLGILEFENDAIREEIEFFRDRVSL